MHGLIGRVISGLGLTTIIITSLQVGGAFTLLPPKVNAALLVISGVATALSERLQGGASNPIVRADAEAADRRKEYEQLNK